MPTRRPNKIRKIKKVDCACGCGKILNKYDNRNRVRKYLPGHSMWINGKPKNTGKPMLKHVKEILLKANKGRDPWNKGKKGAMPRPWNKGMKGKYKLPSVSCKLKGRRLSPKTEFKKGQTPWNKGLPAEQQPNWKNGGVTKLRKVIESNIKYKKWREKVRQRDDYTCRECKERGGRQEIDHHPVSFQEIIQQYNIKTLASALKCSSLWAIDNGRVLCYLCHRKYTAIQMKGG